MISLYIQITKKKGLLDTSSTVTMPMVTPVIVTIVVVIMVPILEVYMVES